MVASNNEEKIVGEQVQLKKEIAELIVKLENSQKVNKTLEINLFSLLKTAKSELARKDKMIDELKKKLDDVTFKRSIHFKPNNYIACKSAFHETSINVHHKLPDLCLFSNETDTDVSLMDSTYKQTNKEQQGKSSLLPVVTVFGERLLKRMTDEQNLENKDKQSSKSNGSNNASGENTEGYVIESDKENGSLGDTNICDTKEIQSSAIAPYQGNEHTKKTFATLSKNTSKDLYLNSNNNTSEIKDKFDRKSTFIGNYSGKRTNEDTSRHISVKRKKSIAEECSLTSSKRETDSGIMLEAKEKYTFPSSRCVNPEFSGNFKWYSRDSRVEVKKHGYFVDDVNKKEGKKDSKDKSGGDVSIATCEKRETSERFSKRYNNKSAENSTLEERNGGYRGCIDTVLKRNGYRANHSEHRRSNQREYHRTEDYRSRIKSTSYAKCREEKYGRNQYNKHSTATTTTTIPSYEERLEKPYNFRKAGVSSDKSRQLFNNNRDFSNGPNLTRSTSKYSTTDRISIDQKASDVKRDNHSTDYDSSERRSKKNTDKTIKREKKQTIENSEHPHRKFNAKKPNEYSKYMSVSERNVKKDDLVIERINNDETTETEREVGIDEELRKYAEEELLDSWTELEDGEISSSSNNENDKRHGRSKDQRCDLPLPPPPPPPPPPYGESVDDDNVTSIKSPKSDPTTIETVEDGLKVSFETNLSNTDDVSVATKRKSSENMENTENAENVENIEKFIRDYASTNEKTFEVISVMSETAPAPHNSPIDVGTTVENDGSALNEISSNYVETSVESCAVLTSNRSNDQIVSFDESPEKNEKLLTTRNVNDEKPGNFANDAATAVAVAVVDHPAVQKDQRTRRAISLKYEKDDSTTELSMATEQPKPENIVKNYDLQNTRGLPSTTFLESFTETDKRKEKDNVDIATNNDTEKKYDYDTCNNHIEGIINENPNSIENRIAPVAATIIGTKAEYKNTSVRVETTREKKMSKLVMERGETRLQENEKLSQSRNQTKNTAKNMSMNVHGKIIVYSRRRKPVCLENSNANMTVLVNNKRDANVHSSNMNDTTTV
ncbi:hypothetical protein ANTPLA_LOCUS6645 [Anthophora plagiata]